MSCFPLKDISLAETLRKVSILSHWPSSPLHSYLPFPVSLSLSLAISWIHGACQSFPDVLNISPAFGNHCHISLLIDTDAPIVWGKSNEKMILTAGCLPALPPPSSSRCSHTQLSRLNASLWISFKPTLLLLLVLITALLVRVLYAQRRRISH